MCLNFKTPLPMRFVMLLMCLITCIACTKSELPSRNYGLTRVDSIRIEINEHTNVQAYAQVLKTSDGEILSSYQFHNGNNNFHWYDLAKGAFHRTLSLQADGPDGVGRVAPVLARMGTDSLWVYEINSNRFYLVNDSGKVIRKIDLGDQLKGSIQSSPAFPHTVADNALHFFQLAEENPNSQEFLKHSKPEGIFHLVTGEYSNGYPDYPRYPEGYELSVESWKVSRCFGKDGVRVYSFPFDNALTVRAAGKTKRYEIPNERFRQLARPPVIEPMLLASHMEFFSKTGLYAYVVYDPYRKCYYRVFIYPSGAYDAAGTLLKIGEKPFEIEIIDDTFRLVGKQAFEGRSYNPYSLVVSEKGLLLSEQNPYHPDEEDFFRYTIFLPELH